MSKKEKLKRRVLSIPSDLKSSELLAFLEMFGYQESSKGATSGSRVMFQSSAGRILFHKPHGNRPVNRITIKQIVAALRKQAKIN